MLKYYNFGTIELKKYITGNNVTWFSLFNVAMRTYKITYLAPICGSDSVSIGWCWSRI